MPSPVQPRPFLPEYTLLKAGELAHALNVDARFVTAMRAAGFLFDRGGRTTLTLAHQWLAANAQTFHGIPRRPKKSKTPL